MESLSEKGTESFAGQKVHKNCQKQLSKGRNVKQIVQKVARVASVHSIRLRGDKENNIFSFKLMCFLCGTEESSKDTENI